MKIDINSNISISSNLDLMKFESNSLFNPSPIINPFADQYIWIQGKQFRILNPSELYRKRNEKDGYYRVIYIQINFSTGEYYIGKANRPTWKRLQRYQGSGLKFQGKYKKHRDEFTRYYIAVCQSAEETEQLESSIVNASLLDDDRCLNLVQGGGCTNKHPSMQELREKKRQYMKQHPEHYQKMIKTAKAMFASGTTPALQARSQRISQVMNTEKYREMTRKRILKWQKEHPEEYKNARQKNAESVRKKETQEKRQRSLAQWKEKHPEEYQKWEQNRKLACQSKESREKHKQSIRNWVKQHPEESKRNAQKRAAASSKVNSKPVVMTNLTTGNVIKEFINARAAAKWLLDEGKTKSKNAAGSIGAVCLGRRQKAYGYLWNFIDVDLKSR